MPVEPSRTVYYRRVRFTTRLPVDYRYAPAHYWLDEIEPGVVRVGLTHFATRMLGEYVESELTVAPEQPVEAGQVIGWIEGFKALSDIYCVLSGKFLMANSQLASQPDLVDRDTYDRGWLYQIEGKIPDDFLDCHAYAKRLDYAIDLIVNQENNKC